MHVAGTSGKTSTSYFITSLLAQSGSKVGLTVSPYITQINERVQINLVPLPEEKFCRDLSEFLKLVEKSGVKPTYFELLIAFAFWVFEREKVDYAVIEVGLGGLLDATNIIERTDKVCVITDIGMDHMEILGSTLAEIAAQKAGIITRKNKVFCYDQSNEVTQQFRRAAKEKEADLILLKSDYAYLTNTNMPNFQKRNATLALKVMEYITTRNHLSRLSEAEIREAIGVVVPARMEKVQHAGKTIFLDGSHNEQKTKALVDSFQELYPNQKTAILIGIMEDRHEHVKSVLEQLIRVADSIIVTSFEVGKNYPRASLDPEIIVELCQSLGFKNARAINDPKQAFEKFIQLPNNPLIVTGSFYMQNSIRPLIFGSNEV